MAKAKTNQEPEVETQPTPEKPVTSVAVQAPKENIIRVGFDTLPGFAALQRIAKVFSASGLVPAMYQNEAGVANCIIAVEMAMRMGASPLMVMQNMYIVHNRPSWSSQFLIASFNSSGRFAAIRYRVTGTKGTDTYGRIAYTIEKSTGDVIEGPEVTIGMSKKEGWYAKNGSKWQSIPELMLCYRAATFLVRTTAPELTMGLRTVDESEDIGEDSVKILQPDFEKIAQRQQPTAQEASFEEAAGELLQEEPVEEFSLNGEEPAPRQ